MAMSVNAADRSLARVASPAHRGDGWLRQSAQDLSKALAAQDLMAARRAFARMLLALPAPAGAPSGMPIAELGSALAVGDIGAARSAFATVSKLRLAAASEPVDVPDVVPSSTGGVAGAMLNTSA